MAPARTLQLFLAVSLAVHGALFLAWRAEHARPPNDAGAPVLGDGSLTVALRTPAPPAKREPASRPAEPDAAHGTAAMPAKQATENVRVDIPGGHEEAGRATPPSTAVRNFLLGRVHTELARHFRYPLLARERGWEGQVVLGFSLLADGHLDRIHIARSSGYHVLDESAREALGRVGMIADAGQWLQGHGVELQLPVIYRLLDR